MIPKVRTVFLYVTDQDRALEFYTEKIGLEMVADDEMWPGARWLEVGAPGAECTIALAASKDFEDKEPGGGLVDFTMAVPDVRALYDELVAKGVEVDEPKEEEWSTSLRFTDPDGNPIVVHERQAAG